MTCWLGVAMVVAQVAAAQVGQRPTHTVEVSGQASMIAVALPRRDVVEIRPRVSGEVSWKRGNRAQWHAEGFLEGLAARRAGRRVSGTAALREAWFEVTRKHGDLRAGFGRLVWGRLDEVQPSDVVNPLDSARFFLEGRTEARLPVGFVRARAFVSERLSIEGVLVPLFRRGRFDQLDEDSSPFNLVSDKIFIAAASSSAPNFSRVAPAKTFANMSGGGRVSGTLGRVDVAASAFRGFDAFGLIALEPTTAGALGAAVVGRIVERYPRFTMIAGDLETVAGDWALRGEVAVFVDKKFQGVTRPGVFDGKAIDAGWGFDRRTGSFHVFGSVVVHRQWSDADPGVEKMDTDVVGSIERQFHGDRYLVRAFAVVNPRDRSGFLRGLLVWSPRDHFSVDASAGAFLGDGDDTIARFSGRDFVMVRGRVSFPGDGNVDWGQTGVRPRTPGV